MTMKPEEYRAIVAEALSKTGAEAEETEGAMLLGFAAVAEWMDPQGERWLTLIDGNASGESCPKWVTRGYLHEALFCWPEPKEDDDEKCG